MLALREIMSVVSVSSVWDKKCTRKPQNSRKGWLIKYLCVQCESKIINSVREKMLTENEITYQIRGAIFDVYRELGPGLLESVYEEALVFELQERGLNVERQVQVPIIYKGNALKTDLRLDLIVEDRVIIELKSAEEMKKLYFKQLLTYLRLMDKKVGLLVNFNTDDILDSIKRIVN